MALAYLGMQAMQHSKRETRMSVSKRRASVRRTRKFAGLTVGAILATATCLSPAEADVIYAWHTVSATVDGVPSGLPASGQIVLTDAGFASGSVSVTSESSFDPNHPVIQTLNGIVSASFGAFDTTL